MNQCKPTRREFLSITSALALAPLQNPSEKILDLHQHVLYSGRREDQLLAHQTQHQ
jgi:hypothetical protein